MSRFIEICRDLRRHCSRLLPHRAQRPPSRRSTHATTACTRCCARAPCPGIALRCSFSLGALRSPKPIQLLPAQQLAPSPTAPEVEESRKKSPQSRSKSQKSRRKSQKVARKSTQVFSPQRVARSGSAVRLTHGRSLLYPTAPEHPIPHPPFAPLVAETTPRTRTHRSAPPRSPEPGP